VADSDHPRRLSKNVPPPNA